MKRKVIAVLILIISFIFGGCSYRDKLYTTDFYTVFLDKDFATVLELTEKGKEQKEIIITSEIMGKPVLKLGKAYIARTERFESEKLKKVYIPETVISIRDDMFICENLEEIYINSNSFNNKLKIMSFMGLGISSIQVEMKKVKFFIPKLSFESIKEEILERYRYMVNPSNLSFNYNYEDSPNEGYYFIDNLSETGKIRNPDNPKREGYAFVSWYLEPEFKNEWDFENDEVIIEKDGEGNLIYSETILYARWARID